MMNIFSHYVVNRLTFFLWEKLKYSSQKNWSNFFISRLDFVIFICMLSLKGCFANVITFTSSFLG